MPRVLHPEWRDYHETTNYPFSDIATLTNGEDFIGDGVFLDAALYPIGATQRMYLASVLIRSNRATIRIGDENSNEIATGEFDIITPPDSLPLTDPFGRPAGLLVSESARLATFQSWSLGEHEFLDEQTEFSARVSYPTPEIGVRGFLLDDGEVVADDAWIIGEDGVVVRAEEIEVPVPGFTGETEIQQVIRVDVVGDPLFRRRLCDDVFVTPRLLKTVTFRHGCEKIVCGPDMLGDLKVSVSNIDQPDTILRIRAVPEGLIFEAVGETLEGII